MTKYFVHDLEKPEVVLGLKLQDGWPLIQANYHRLVGKRAYRLGSSQ